MNHICIFILVTLLELTLSINQSLRYIQETDRDIVETNGLIETTNFKNKFECLNRCTTNDNCHLVFFKNSLCKLFNKAYVMIEKIQLKSGIYIKNFNK